METERLLIRPFRKEDYLNWYTQFNNNQPSQYKYDEGYADISPHTPEWFYAWVKRLNDLAEKDELYNFGVFRKEDGTKVGKVEISTILRREYQWAVMGYAIHNQFWRNGYGVESVLAVSASFFTDLNFNRIELHINVDNLPSIQLAERAGFIFESKRKAFSFENGQWTDLFIYYKNK